MNKQSNAKDQDSKPAASKSAGGASKQSASSSGSKQSDSGSGGGGGNKAGRASKGVQGGTHEQHVAAGRQSHKNDKK